MSEKKNFGKGGGRSKYIAYLYLAIAVCVVAVMTVSIYSLSFGTDVPDDLSISIPDIPTPSIPDINDNEPTGDESDSEVGGTWIELDGTNLRRLVNWDDDMLVKVQSARVLATETLAGN